MKKLIVCTLIVTYLTLGHSKLLHATSESLLRWQTDMIHRHGESTAPHDDR